MTSGTRTPAVSGDAVVSGDVVLSAHDLQRRFQQGATIISPVVDVDMELRSGEFAAIVGSSGSGKTTLLQLLGGLDRPDAGEVRIDDVATSLLSDRDLTQVRARRLGIVFQQFNLVPTLTARENIEAPLVALGEGATERGARADDLLDQVGLGDRADHVPAKLSGGEQQRVAIARALAARPGLLLADEPTGNLDRATGDQILDLLVELVRERGVALLVVTHDERVAARADRIFEIEAGRLRERPAPAPADDVDRAGDEATTSDAPSDARSPEQVLLLLAALVLLPLALLLLVRAVWRAHHATP